MMSLVATVWVLQMYHADPQVPIPDWIIMLVKCMGATTCQKTKVQKFRMALESGNNMTSKNKPVIPQNGHIDHVDGINRTSFESTDTKVNENNLILSEILQELRKLNSSNTGSEFKVNIMAWRIASDIVDYFFAILFLVIIIIINILLFVFMLNKSR